MESLSQVFQNWEDFEFCSNYISIQLLSRLELEKLTVYVYMVYIQVYHQDFQNLSRDLTSCCRNQRYHFVLPIWFLYIRIQKRRHSFRHIRSIVVWFWWGITLSVTGSGWMYRLWRFPEWFESFLWSANIETMSGNQITVCPGEIFLGCRILAVVCRKYSQMNLLRVLLGCFRIFSIFFSLSNYSHRP